MEHVRKALGRLVLGKALTVLLGLLVLVLLWRRVAPSAYGQYLSLLAGAEILSAISSLGLSTVAQRHLPVWIAHAQSPGQAWGRIAQILLLRIVLAGIFLVIFLAFASSRWFPWPEFPAPPDPTPALALVLATILMRSLEEIQAALLMQAWIQGLATAAHGARLLALSSLGSAAPADLDWLISLELSIAGTVAAIGVLATVLRTWRKPGSEKSLLNEAPCPWFAAWRRSLEFWVIQCLGLAWSLHVLRLMLHAVAGPMAVAVHSVAFSMAESLRQATPLVWMAGWLRAAMLHLQAEQPQGPMALGLASAIHRLSLLMLWPVVCAWCVEPAAWFRWAGGTEMFNMAQDLSRDHPLAPAATGLLAATAVLAPIQNRHLLLSLWATVLQRPGWGVPASVGAALAVSSFAGLWPLLGLWSAPAVMVLAEVLWITTASRGWDEARLDATRRWHAAALPLMALTAAGMASLALDQVPGHPAELRLFIPLICALAATAILSWARSPWTAEERAALAHVLPPGFVALPWRWLRRSSW